MKHDTKEKLKQMLLSFCGSTNIAKLRLLIGAKHITYDDSKDGIVSLFFSFVGSRKFNKCCLSYHSGSDLFSMKLQLISKGEIKNQIMANEIYCDEFQRLFEENTGLYTSFNAVTYS